MRVKLRSVTAEDTRLPPTIVNGPQNQTLPLGGMASLLCVVDGQPTPEVYWFKNDRVLPSVGRNPRLVLVNSGTLQISGNADIYFLSGRFDILLPSPPCSSLPAFDLARGLGSGLSALSRVWKLNLVYWLLNLASAVTI